MSQMQGKTVLITGASRGIGASAARVFADAGANVALVARSEDAIADLTSELGENAIAIPCDVSRYWEVEKAVNACVSTFGSLDVLINNAGVINPISRLIDTDPDAWSHALDINMKGVFNCARAALPVMVENGGGTILSLGSGAATNPSAGWSHYCTAKAGTLMLSKMIDAEMRAQNIRSISLRPGTVATQMQREINASGVNPERQMDWSVHVPPEWPAKALLWMCSAEADEYLGGEVSLRDEEIRKKVGLL